MYLQRHYLSIFLLLSLFYNKEVPKKKKKKKKKKKIEKLSTKY